MTKLLKKRFLDFYEVLSIMMFGDWDWLAKRSDKQEALFNRWIKSQASKKLAIIEIGAGVAIPSVRMQGEHIAKRYQHATLIRINPRDFTFDKRNSISLPLGGLEGIKAILEMDESANLQEKIK
jgi:hypothetical protein